MTLNAECFNAACCNPEHQKYGLFCSLSLKWMSWHVLTNFLQTFYETSYELLMNFSWTSHELLMNFLWASHELLMSFLWASYELLMNFLQTSYELLTNFLWNFLWTSYELLMNFSWTSHELLMSFLWASYELLKNFSWASSRRVDWTIIVWLMTRLTKSMSDKKHVGILTPHPWNNISLQKRQGFFWQYLTNTYHLITIPIFYLYIRHGIGMPQARAFVIGKHFLLF